VKTKTQLKLICQIFHFVYNIQQNFTIWNGVKTLQITPICNGVVRTFSYTQAWLSEGGPEFEHFSKKALFLVSSGKKQISPLSAPLEKLLEKSTSVPPGKNPSNAHTHKHAKLHCKKLCCITPSGNTVQQHQFG